MKDKDILLRIIKIEKTILKLYKKLYDLEINNLKDTKKYKELLNNLRLSILIEDDLFKNIDKQKLKKYLNNINCSYLLNTLSDFDFLFNKYEHLYIAKRLYEIINYQEDDLLKNLIKEDNEIYFLDQIESLSKYNREYIDRFIECKYILAFLNKNIELELLSNNFNINNSLVSKSYAILNDIEKDDYDLIFCDYLSNNLYKYMMYFLEIKSLNNLDQNDIIKIIYYQVLIKSITVFADIGLLNSLLFDIYDILDKESVNKAIINRIKYILNNQDSIKNEANILIIERIKDESSK